MGEEVPVVCWLRCSCLKNKILHFSSKINKSGYSIGSIRFYFSRQTGYNIKERIYKQVLAALLLGK